MTESITRKNKDVNSVYGGHVCVLITCVLPLTTPNNAPPLLRPDVRKDSEDAETRVPDGTGSPTVLVGSEL